MILTAAARVLSKGHHVLHNVELIVRKPASKDQCRLLLRGISPNTSTEMIELYVENMMGLNESDYTLYPSPGRDFTLIHLSQPLSSGVFSTQIFFFSENLLMYFEFFQMLQIVIFFHGTVLILFRFCLVDFQNLSSRISKRTLDGARVTLEQIEQTDSVLVENLRPGTSVDLLTLYFENRGVGDQPLKEVTKLSEATAKVSFVSYDCKFNLKQPFKLCAFLIVNFFI